MNKFKPGDKIVNVRGFHNKGLTATVLEVYPDFSDPLVLPEMNDRSMLVKCDTMPATTKGSDGRFGSGEMYTEEQSWELHDAVA